MGLATGSGRQWPDHDLTRFRDVQRLAYRGAQTVAAELEPGMTERDAARALRHWLTANGVNDWFHLPFAWFGDRTAFRGFHQPLQFFPTNRRLEADMPVILDCAPMIDGYTADIGYACCVGENPIQQQMIDDLPQLRDVILEAVGSGATFRDVYLTVDRAIAGLGYENRHRIYPGRVIAHRVGRVHRGLPKRIVAGFGSRSIETLGREIVFDTLRARSPLWSDDRASDHAPTAGLWAVEPHLGFREVGVKFEEILVVTGDPARPAYWLDDDVPHVRRAKVAA
jgi:Xaa-Pro aminopeptidase